MSTNFRDPRSRDCELRQKKIIKKCDFLFKNLMICLQAAQLKFYTMWVIISGSCKPSLRAPGHMTKLLQAENMLKVCDFEPIYIGKYRF